MRVFVTLVSSKIPRSEICSRITPLWRNWRWFVCCFCMFWTAKELNQHRLCLLDKERSSLSMFHNNWKAFGVPATTGYFCLSLARFFLKLTNKPPSGSFPPLKQCPALWDMSAMLPRWKKSPSLFLFIFCYHAVAILHNNKVRGEDATMEFLRNAHTLSPSISLQVCFFSLFSFLHPFRSVYWRLAVTARWCGIGAAFIWDCQIYCQQSKKYLST